MNRSVLVALRNKLRVLFHQHPIGTTVAGITAAVIGVFQFADYQHSRAWPQQWQCHARIQLGRLNHGRPEIYLPASRPGESDHPLPYLAGMWDHLRSGDSLSKAWGAMQLYVVRDSAATRTINQWAWNETTREFEFAGRFVRKR
jgi:hypothetical protein